MVRYLAFAVCVNYAAVDCDQIALRWLQEGLQMEFCVRGDFQTIPTSSFQKLPPTIVQTCLNSLEMFCSWNLASGGSAVSLLVRQIDTVAHAR
jgi:hypothetical protein